MKDNILLLTAGLVCALLAWLFYHYLGEYAVSIFLTIIFVSLLVSPIKSKFGHSKKKPNE